jgi:hypothetical protein
MYILSVHILSCIVGMEGGDGECKVGRYGMDRTCLALECRNDPTGSGE